MDTFRQPMEIVEDSEPERQENWRRERDERMKYKSNNRPRIIEVIELSDSEPSFSEPIGVHTHQATDELATRNDGKTVISISEDDSFTPVRESIAQDIPPPDTSPSNSTASTSVNSSSLSFNVKEVVAGMARNNESPFQTKDLGSESGSEDEASVAFRDGIGQFAFSSKPSAPSANRLVRTTSSSSALPAPKTARIKSAHTNYLEFSEGQLSFLRKCVSCEVKWTTRKSVAQKITHIRSCTKKALMTEDTIKLLLTREIETSQAETRKQTRKPESQRPKAPEPPKTFIEEVITDGGIQKVKKNSKVASSLKSVAESRNTILEKASSILAPQLTRVHEVPPPTLPLGSSKLPSNMPNRIPREADIMSTQPFGHSSLAGRFGRPTATEASSSHSRNYLSSAHQLPESLEPPPTQNFAPSRLGNLQRTHSLFDQDSPPSSINANNPDLFMNMETPPEFTPVNDDDDDAILIWDPDAYPPPRTPSPAKPKRKQRKRMTKTKALNLNTNSEETDGQTIEDDAELGRRLKDMVLANETLYLRILRYEPIHFDVFMEMAKNNGINAVGLRTKMRAFLDKQAISHYGNEPGGSRSRH